MKCVLIGAGGHARVLIEACQPVRVTGILAIEPGLTEKFGVPVLGGDELLLELLARGYSHFLVGVGSAKSCARREMLFEQASRAGLQPVTIIHPTAFISNSARLGDGCQILPKAIVHAGANLGTHILVNSAAVVEHDCIIGEHTHIATGAILCGAVQVGRATHVGAGAVIRQGIRIGDRVVVGAGAVVVRDVPDEAVVIGVPARPIQTKSLLGRSQSGI